MRVYLSIAYLSLFRAPAAPRPQNGQFALLMQPQERAEGRRAFEALAPHLCTMALATLSLQLHMLWGADVSPAAFSPSQRPLLQGWFAAMSVRSSH